MYRSTSNSSFNRPSFPSAPAETHVTSATAAVKNAHAAPKVARPDLRSTQVEPHWEPVIDLATD
jgi:hypothetical protein